MIGPAIRESGKYTLSVECRFAASHVLPGCPPCDRLHGHTWRVRTDWVFTGLGALGMGMNFRVLREALDEHIKSKFDHHHLNDVAPFDDVPPTAENLARVFFQVLEEGFDAGAQGRLSRVEVWEGPETFAAFER